MGWTEANRGGKDREWMEAVAKILGGARVRGNVEGRQESIDKELPQLRGVGR